MPVPARTIVWLVVAALAVAGPLSAQPSSDGGRLTGRVTDGSGAALPGVTVTLRPDGPGTPATLVTDGVGQYESPSLPPDVYVVTFDLPGFETRTRADVELRAGELYLLDQQLGLASLAETVEVVADAPAPSPPQAEPAVEPLPLPAISKASVPVPVSPAVLASVCGPGQATDASLTIGHLVAHRDEPGRRLYGRGDALVLDVGADLGLEAGQNLVVRRRFLAGDRARPFVRSNVGEQTAGLVQIVEAGTTSAIAVVVHACAELFAGDAVEPFDALPMWTARAPRTPQYDDPAHVILGEHGQTLGGPRQLMVIDRGAMRGAERGQRLTIFRRSLGAHGPVVSIAEAIIVAVRAESATIRIERSSDAVSVGDLVALHR